jgi:hypothetical protein
LSEDSKFRQIFGLKTVHLLALFILVYVGVEVTIGGKPWPVFSIPCIHITFMNLQAGSLHLSFRFEAAVPLQDIYLQDFLEVDLSFFVFEYFT